MRILIHFTHKQTFGHTTRSFSLARALAHRGADVLILQGGVPQPFIASPTNCTLVDIPHPFDSRKSFQGQTKPFSSEIRSDFIFNTTQEFNPDVFISEFFPFGRLDYTPELLSTLRYLHKKKKRIIASIGYPLISDLDKFQEPKFAAFKHALFNFFDLFLIHTPSELETPYFEQTLQSSKLAQIYREIIHRLEDRIRYTGYIFPDKLVTGGEKISVGSSRNFIITSRGGGSVFAKIILAAMKAAKYLDKSYLSLIAYGPATPLKERQCFHAMFDSLNTKNIHLTNYFNNLHDILQSCRLSISLSGYNTSIQLMRYGTPSILIPYYSKHLGNLTNDQIARAKLLQNKFSSVVLDCHTLTTHTLVQAIQRQLDLPPPKPAPTTWFSGAETAAKIILQDRAN